MSYSEVKEMTTYIYSAIDKESGKTVKNKVSSTTLTLNAPYYKTYEGFRVDMDVFFHEASQTETSMATILCVDSVEIALARMSESYSDITLVEVQ